MRKYTEEDANACWYCGIFMSVFNTINEMATAIFDNLSTSFISLLGIGLLFTILFKVGKLVLQFKAVDVMQFLDDLLKPLGRGIIAMALLYAVTTQTNTVFTMITAPVFEVSAKLGGIVMDSAIPNNVQLIQAEVGTGTYVYHTGVCDNAPRQNGNGRVFIPEQGETLRCWMQKVSSSFITGIAIGASLVSVGIEADGFFDSMPILLTGCIMWLVFWLLYLIFPFQLIDAFVRMTFVLTLMPLWIILWVFPITASYTKRAWEMFLSVCLFIIILSIMVSLTIILMGNAIPESDREGLLRCLRAGNDTAAATWIFLGSGALLNTIAFGAMSWMLLTTAEPLANSFVNGGGSLKIGSGIVGSGVKAVSATVEVGKGVANAGLWGLSALGGLAMAAGRRSVAGIGNAGSNSSGSGGSGASDSGSAPAARTGRYNENGTNNENQNDNNGNRTGTSTNTSNNNLNNNTTMPSQTNEKPEDNSTNPNKPAENNSEVIKKTIEAQNTSEQPTLSKGQEKTNKVNKEQSELQKRQVSELQNQQRQETDTTERKQTRQEEAIQKLHENPQGMQAVRDTQTNMAFIQEQMASASSVSELRDNLKNHNWAYSGANRDEYVRSMTNAAEYMMNAQKAENPDRIKREVTTALNNSLKHGNISDTDAIVNSVVQQMGENLSSLNDILANLTKKE